ncbi:hypothetical protein [Radiobacillus sp. PE A8.2]
MEKNILNDLSEMGEGEQFVNQQIMESYHSGVIDHDVRREAQQNKQQE